MEDPHKGAPLGVGHAELSAEEPGQGAFAGPDLAGHAHGGGDELVFGILKDQAGSRTPTVPRQRGQEPGQDDQE